MALEVDTGQANRPRRAVSSKATELQTAMEILAEVFGTRPGEVEEMIQRRLEAPPRRAVSPYPPWASSNDSH